MKLALCPVTAGGGLPWPEYVALAGRTGYDAVEVDLTAVDRMAEGDDVQPVMELFASCRVEPGCCALPLEFRKDEATFEAGLKQLDRYARLAERIGCPRMATWVPPVFERPGREMRAILRRRFTQAASVLAGCGVRLGLEFISPEHIRQGAGERVCIWQMQPMLELAAECGPNVGLLLDCWHWHHDPDAGVEDILRAGRDRVVHVHLNDSPDLPPDRIRDNERLLPGEGVIDLTGFLGALKKIGYEGVVSVEVFGRLAGMEHDAAAKAALEASRAVLARVP